MRHSKDRKNTKSERKHGGVGYPVKQKHTSCRGRSEDYYIVAGHTVHGLRYPPTLLEQANIFRNKVIDSSATQWILG